MRINVFAAALAGHEGRRLYGSKVSEYITKQTCKYCAAAFQPNVRLTLSHSVPEHPAKCSDVRAVSSSSVLPPSVRFLWPRFCTGNENAPRISTFLLTNCTICCLGSTRGGGDINTDDMWIREKSSGRCLYARYMRFQTGTKGNVLQNRAVSTWAK
jgi:hypothetical protein